jgi:hypothetical protein
MAISYMIDKLQMKYVGYLESESFPPLVSIHKSEPMPPIRVYCREGKDCYYICGICNTNGTDCGAQQGCLPVYKVQRNNKDIFNRRATYGSR